MIYFLCNRENHITYKDIIKHLKSGPYDFGVLNPYEAEDIIYDKIKNNNNILLIMLPSYPNIYKICDLAIRENIKTINDAQITKKFLNRSDIENFLSNLLYSQEKSPFIRKIFMPKTWHIFTEEEYENFDRTEFYLALRKMFENELPLIVKYPINHSGIHFVRRVNKMEDLLKLHPILKDTGLIIQKFIHSNEQVYKCYNLGDKIITQSENYKIYDLNINSFETTEEILKSNQKIISEEKHKERKTVKTPPLIRQLAEFISKKMNLEIFGFDFIKDINGRYVIVDINDFPGCRGVNNAGKIISDYILNVYKENFKILDNLSE